MQLPQHITGDASDEALIVLQALGRTLANGKLTVAGMTIRVARGRLVSQNWKFAIFALLHDTQLRWSWRRTIGVPDTELGADVAPMDAALLRIMSYRTVAA